MLALSCWFPITTLSAISLSWRIAHFQLWDTTYYLLLSWAFDSWWAAKRGWRRSIGHGLGRCGNFVLTLVTVWTTLYMLIRVDTFSKTLRLMRGNHLQSKVCTWHTSVRIVNHCCWASSLERAGHVLLCWWDSHATAFRRENASIWVPMVFLWEESARITSCILAILVVYGQHHGSPPLRWDTRATWRLWVWFIRDAVWENYRSMLL